MKKGIILLLVTFCGGLTAQSDFKPIQNAERYQVYLNLTSLENDQLLVEIVPPLVSVDSLDYHIPKVIPGTYDVHNYGMYLSDFKALGPEGEALEVKRLSKNRWRIYQAFDLYKITYKVDDTYDFEGKTGIFEPAGTSIDDSVFLLNNFGFVGYIKGQKEKPFELRIKKPAGFYGSTALVVNSASSEDTDVFTTKNYFELHDNPILYCEPDTASIMVGGAKVLVSVFAPQKQVNAKEALKNISEVLQASANYLGGALPVDKYAVLIYCVDPKSVEGGYGALEHHKSTVLYMPEVNSDFFYKGVQDITAHEFFHIITPLNIHSEQIHNFDFINPEMSKHIWFYEGVTEYNSIIVQIRNGIIDEEEFLDQVQDKMETADTYNQGVPLTVASKFTLTFLKDEYLNFYAKGALAGLALDLKLRSLSEGDYGLPDLLIELGQTYGQDTFFTDVDFFDIITEKTYPEMREFFAMHYESSAPFPFKELFNEVGVTYIPEEAFERFSYGGIGFSYNPETERLVVDDLSAMDPFGLEMGYELGDELISFNGDSLTIQTLQTVMNRFFQNTEVGDKIRVVVARPREDGSYKTKKLKAKAILVPDVRKHVLLPQTELSPQQTKIKTKWINL
jgi:predicted metalloprotease with PDZ domain